MTRSFGSRRQNNLRPEWARNKKNYPVSALKGYEGKLNIPVDSASPITSIKQSSLHKLKLRCLQLMILQARKRI